MSVHYSNTKKAELVLTINQYFKIQLYVKTLLVTCLRSL